MTIRVTTDPGDPGIGKPAQDGQHEKYLILSEKERREEFVRPMRLMYLHKKCGRPTKMGVALAESFARDPTFYSQTFCAHCQAHFPVSQFTWPDNTEVGS